MTARLVINPCAAAVGAGNACAVVIDGIEINNDSSFVPLLTRNLNQVASHLGDLAQNPVYQGFARQMEEMGYPNTVAANEKLLKAFVSKGIRSINNVVDAYNAIAIRHGVSIGVHTYEQVEDIHVFRAHEPMKFRPLFAKKDAAVPAGDLVYTCADSLLACIGKTDADAHDFRLTDASSRLVAVVLGHHDTPLDFNRQVLEELVGALRETMPGLRHHFLERAAA
ncbi:hypothetical protein PMM47T1_20428 [Pseudomonas sp. M47T1]|uniref:phenylalanine--tRNA ligase beta subunit-related protein n=1 Tax=unclassified Pseudomonas TaxID=196821 RepID=UPI0002606C5E|nr:phenylalanine--tRNA ligase beta subunit-related protein [Pseudomonas sp. M47T1]EIK94700.1 hypothetical protein PMM47T1_20428 [Pseudomonas sp. M47T1]